MPPPPPRPTTTTNQPTAHKKHNTRTHQQQTKPEGQIHFFPIIFNGKQVYDVMVERCGPSVGSGRK